MGEEVGGWLCWGVWSAGERRCRSPFCGGAWDVPCERIVMVIE